MTKQGIFNRIARHFKRQRWAAERGESCKYRVERNGKLLRCAVGAFIPKNLYRPDMEGKASQNLVKLGYVKADSALGRLLNDNRGLFADLQNVHDFATMAKKTNGLYNLLTEATARAMRNVAKEHGLDASEVDWA